MMSNTKAETDSKRIIIKYLYGGEEYSCNSFTDDDIQYNIVDIAYAYETFKIKLDMDLSESNKLGYRLSKQWDFGDGTIVYDKTAVHSYKKPGRYKITCHAYSLVDGVEDTIYTIYITVKEAFASTISFLEKTPSEFYISKNNEIGSLFVNVSNYFINKPRILAYLTNEDNFKNENNTVPSYWNLRYEKYYHLNPYFCFLEEDNGENIDERLIYSLKPVEYYTPHYYNVYGYHYRENDILKLKLFVLFEPDEIFPDKDSLDEYKSNLFCVETIENENSEELYNVKISNDNITIEPIYSVYNLDPSAAYLGMISKTSIWFKNDIYKEGITNKLAFEFYENDMFSIGEENLEDSYLNFKTTFVDIELKRVSENLSLVKALTLNGILSDSEIIGELQSENENINYKIDSYLKKYIYKNKDIDIYQGFYIKNDPITKKCINNNEKIITYSLYKDNIEVSLPELAFYQSDNNDKNFTSFMPGKVEDMNYIKIYHNLKPDKEYIKINEDGIEIYKNKRDLIDLNILTLPTEHKVNVDIERLLNAYMGHPVYNNANNLKTMLFDILSNKNTLEYIMRKSEHFVDDNSNYRTCHISSLIDILTMLGEDVNDYNINTLTNFNELKELLRILSMSYSDLMGKIEETYDIEITSTYKGKNISDLINLNDEIICDNNYEIIAIVKNDKLYELKKKTPFIVCQDNKSNSTSLLSFYGINSYNKSSKESELKQKFKNIINFNVYKLKEYQNNWGWNLLINKESLSYNDKELAIEQFYNFYLFNPDYIRERKHNFVDQDTIPYDNNEAVDIKEWDNLSYDYLMKVLVENVLDA